MKTFRTQVNKEWCELQVKKDEKKHGCKPTYLSNISPEVIRCMQMQIASVAKYNARTNLTQMSWERIRLENQRWPA